MMRIVIALIFSIASLTIFQSCEPDANSSTQGTTSLPKETKPVQEIKKQDNPVQAKDNRAEAERRQQVAKNVPVQEQPAGANTAGKLQQQQVQKSQDKSEINSSVILPNACTLVSKAKISSIIGVKALDVQQKDGSSKQSKFSRSCFFRWEHEGVPNSGILLQVQKNPVPDEFAGWATSFIDSKKENGETDFSGAGEVFKYKNLPNLGSAGAYSHELGKYYWRVDDKFVCMVAFNIMDSTEKEQLSWATQIGKLMTASL